MGFLSTRLQSVKPSPTFALSALTTKMRASGIDVIDLGVGELDFDTPEFIKQAAIQAIKDGYTKYTPVAGIPSLRQAVCQAFQRVYQIGYEADQITIGCGAKQVIFNALLATTNPGDEVIIPTPYWVSYPDMVNLVGGKLVLAPCPQDQGFKLRPDQLRKLITPQTKWLILNSPNNPSGAVYTESELKILAKVLLDYPQVWVLSDDIYGSLTYDNIKAMTIAAVEPGLKDRTLTVSGASKIFSMTGWRLGYAGGPRDLIAAMNMVQSHSTTHPCSITQYAVAAALSGSADFLPDWLKTLEKRRNLLWDCVEDLGLDSIKPEGAFYIYASCQNLIGKKTSDGNILKNDQDVAQYFLSTAYVASVPGSAFGLSPYLRLSFATPEDKLKKACSQIKKQIEALS